MLRMIEKPFAVVDREPRPGKNRSEAEAHADPEVFAPRGRRPLDELELGPVRDHEAREDDGQRRQNPAPGDAVAFFGVANVRDDRHEHGNHGHEHARKRCARKANANGEERIENDVPEKGKSERFEDVGTTESRDVFAKEPKAGKRNDPERDEAPESDKHGVVVRNEEGRDVDEAPERSGRNAEKNTRQHGLIFHRE